MCLGSRSQGRRGGGGEGCTSRAQGSQAKNRSKTDETNLRWRQGALLPKPAWTPRGRCRGRTNEPFGASWPHVQWHMRSPAKREGEEDELSPSSPGADHTSLQVHGTRQHRAFCDELVAGREWGSCALYKGHAPPACVHFDLPRACSDIDAIHRSRKVCESGRARAGWGVVRNISGLIWALPFLYQSILMLPRSRVVT